MTKEELRIIRSVYVRVRECIEDLKGVNPTPRVDGALEGLRDTSIDLEWELERKP